jgi:hypothetical protein
MTSPSHQQPVPFVLLAFCKVWPEERDHAMFHEFGERGVNRPIPMEKTPPCGHGGAVAPRADHGAGVNLM